jgi:ABC-2 type transport system permease protein
MNWLRRTFAISGKELRQLMRDRLTLGMIIGIPVMQILLFGYAINMDVRHLPIAVADQANSNLSRQLVHSMQASQVVTITHQVQGPEEIEKLLRSGEVSIGVFIPHDFERRIISKDRAAAHLLIDASDPVILGIAKELGRQSTSAHFVPKSLSDKPAGLFEVRAYYNPERRTEVQIVPGLIGVILTLTMVLFTSVAIVREKERGNMEFLITTPVKTSELMVGKIIPYIMIGLVQVAIILIIGKLIFATPIRGSLFELYLGAAVFICASLTLGLLISTVAASQFQAFQFTLFLFLPSLLLSGFMFPFDGMPKWAQYIAEILPLTHFTRIARGILLRGASLSEMSQEVLALVLFFIVAMGLSILRFQKRLD